MLKKKVERWTQAVAIPEKRGLNISITRPSSCSELKKTCIRIEGALAAANSSALAVAADERLFGRQMIFFAASRDLWKIARKAAGCADAFGVVWAAAGVKGSGGDGDGGGEECISALALFGAIIDVSIFVISKRTSTAFSALSSSSGFLELPTAEAFP